MSDKITKAYTFIPSDADARKILHQRAAAFAASSEGEKHEIVGSPYVKFRLSENELYGIEFVSATAVIQAVNMKKPPCVSPIICGVINHQGKLIGVFDLEKILNLKPHTRDAGKCCNIIIVNSAEMTVGMMVGEIEMSDSYQNDSLAGSILTESDSKDGFIKGIDKGKISILDVEKILKYVSTEGAVS